MRTIRSFVSLCGFVLLLATATSPLGLAQSNRQESAPVIDVTALLTEAGYKYVEVRNGLWKVPDIPYRGKNLRKLIIFLEPNAYNKTLRVSIRLGFLKDEAETTALKAKLDDLRKQFKPTEFQLSGIVLFVYVEPPADKLDKTSLVKTIKELADVSDQAFSELEKFIELDLESSGAGVGAGAAGPGAISPSVLKPPDRPEPYAAKEVDSKPVILNHVQPRYTKEARDNQVQGTVTLRVLVDETGQVTQTRVVRSLPFGLTQQAIEAAHEVKFKPAMKDDKPVPFWVTLQMTFTLR